jgi:hypothetical protein
VLAGRFDRRSLKAQLEGALGKADDYVVTVSFRLIVGGKFLAKPPGLQPDDGVMPGVVGTRFPESLYTYGVLFEAIGFPVESFFSQVLQETAMDFRRFESLALHQAIHLGTHNIYPYNHFSIS